MGEWNESVVVTVIVVAILLIGLCCAGNRKNLKCQMNHPNRIRRKNTTKASSRCSRESSVRTATFTFTPERSFATSSCQSSISRPSDPLEDEIRQILKPFPTKSCMGQTNIGVYQEHQLQNQQHQQHYQHQHQHQHLHHQPFYTPSGGRSFHGTTSTPSSRISPSDAASWSRSVSLPTKFRPEHKRQYPKSPPPSRNDRVSIGNRVNFYPGNSQQSDTDEETNLRGAIIRSQNKQPITPASSAGWNTSTTTESPYFATCGRKSSTKIQHFTTIPEQHQPAMMQQIDQVTQFGRAKHLSLIKSNKPTRERKNSLDLIARSASFRQRNGTIYEEPNSCIHQPESSDRNTLTSNLPKGILVHSRFQSSKHEEFEQDARMKEMDTYYQYYDDENTPLTSLSPSSLTSTYPDTTESSYDFERFNYVTVRHPYFLKDLEMEEHFV